MELTKEYFDQQLGRFATKDDLLELATKNDLGAVRSDIVEVKELVLAISEREDQDTRAVMRDVADLHRRVTALEQRPSYQNKKQKGRPFGLPFLRDGGSHPPRFAKAT